MTVDARLIVSISRSFGIVERYRASTRAPEWLKQGGLANVALPRWRRHRLSTPSSGGLEPDAPLFFDRAVEVAGKTEQAQFRTVRIPRPTCRWWASFVCEHLTPSSSIAANGPGSQWRAWHPGRDGDREQPAKWIVELERYFGAGSVTRDGGGAGGRYRHQPIRYLTRTGYASANPGVTPCGRAIIRRSCRGPSTAGCLRGAACEERRQAGEARCRPPDLPPAEAAHLTLEFRSADNVSLDLTDRRIYRIRHRRASAFRRCRRQRPHNNGAFLQLLEKCPVS